MEFDSIWSKREELTGSVIILESTQNAKLQAPAVFAYFAYVARSLAPFSLPTGGLTLEQAIETISVFHQPGHFVLFFTRYPLNEINTRTVEANLRELCLGPHHLANFTRHTGHILWLPDLPDIDLAKSPCLRLIRDEIFGWHLDQSRPSLIVPDPGEHAIFLSAPNIQAGMLSFDGPGNIQLKSPSDYLNLDICIGTVERNVPVATNTLAHLELTLDPQGNDPQLQLNGASTTELFTVPMGFNYSLLPSSGLGTSAGLTPINLFYPLWVNPRFGGTDWASLYLNPLEHTGSLTFGIPYHLFLASQYRDLLGRRLYLGYQGDDAPVFQLSRGLDGKSYFTPDCSFELTLESESSSATTEDVTIVCGLAGNETLTIPAGQKLTFQAGQPAGITMTAPNSGSGPTGFAWSASENSQAPLYHTSALALPGDGGFAYEIQSQKAPLFDASDAGNSVLDILDVGAIAVSKDSLVPLLPYDGIEPFKVDFATAAELFVGLENSCLAPTRKRIFTNGNEVKFKPDAKAITPQGIMVQTTGSDTMEVFAGTQDPATAPILIQASNTAGEWATALFEGLTTPQTFVVISSQPSQAGSSVQVSTRVDGWNFDFQLPEQAPADFSGPIVILQAAGAPLAQLVTDPTHWAPVSTFNNNGFDPQGNLLAAYLRAKIDETRALYADGRGIELYADFLAMVDDPDWNGLLVFNAPLDIAGSDTTVHTMLVGIDPAGVPPTAHHIGVTAAKVGPQDSAKTNVGTGPAPASCAFFGIVDYLRPGGTPGDAMGGNPGFVTSTTNYDFRLTYMRAKFKNSKLLHFESAALLVLSRLFNETVSRFSLDGGQASGSNSIFLLGTAHQGPDDKPVYAFSAPANTFAGFYLASTAVNQVVISDVSTSMNIDGSDVTVDFVFQGWINLRNNPALDLLSYDAIEYRGLSVTMKYDAAQWPPYINIEPAPMNTVAFLHPGEAPTATSPSAISPPKVNLFRPGSLVGQMPLRLSEFIISEDGKTPTELGYQPITPPEGLTPATLGPTWFGLALPLSLGTTGTSSSNGLISAEILLAWSPNEKNLRGISVAPFLAFVGADGQPLDLEIEGVIKLGAKTLRLSSVPATQKQNQQADGRNGPGRFVLELQGLGLSVLSTTIPAGGGLTVYLSGFGDDNGNRKLGWFGGLGQYVDVPAK